MLLDAATVDAAAPAADGLASILVQAVVQGLTEFLPVSSSGHLVLARELLGAEGPGLVQSVALHVGTLLAVLIVYRSDLVRLVRGLGSGRWTPVFVLAVGTVPAVVVGLFLKSRFHAALESPTVAAWGLLVTAAMLTWGELSRRRLARSLASPAPSRDPEAGRAPETGTAPVVAPRDEPTLADGLFIGCLQALAILPGISRSGSTIAAGLSRGLEPQAAARFSFLLSIPAIGGAALLETKEALELGVPGLDPLHLAAGVAASALVGWVALRLLLALLQRAAFLWFAFYCGTLGLSWLLLA